MNTIRPSRHATYKNQVILMEVNKRTRGSSEKNKPKVLLKSEILPLLGKARLREQINTSSYNEESQLWKSKLLPRGEIIHKKRVTLKDRINEGLSLDFIGSLSTDNRLPQLGKYVSSKNHPMPILIGSTLESKSQLSQRSFVEANRKKSEEDTLALFNTEQNLTQQIDSVQLNKKLGKFEARCRLRCKPLWSVAEGLSKMYNQKMTAMKIATEQYAKHLAEIENKKELDQLNFGMKKKEIEEISESARKKRAELEIKRERKINFREHVQGIIKWHRRALKMRLNLSDLIDSNLLPKQEYELPQSRQFLMSVNQGDTAVIGSFLRQDKRFLYQFDAIKRTALHKAVSREDLAMVKYLLNHHPDLEAKDLFGQTPLGIALKKENIAIVRELMNAGADPIEGVGNDTPCEVFMKKTVVMRHRAQMQRKINKSLATSINEPVN